jgi:hypothetical protein
MVIQNNFDTLENVLDYCPRLMRELSCGSSAGKGQNAKI